MAPSSTLNALSTLSPINILNHLSTHSLRNMKFNILLAIVAIALGYITCKNMSKTAEPAPVSSVPSTAESNRLQVGHNAAYVFEGSHPDTAGTLQTQGPPRRVDVPIDALPAPTASHKAYLATGYWHINMAISPTDSTIYRSFQHRYFKFREDQTFDLIFQGKILETGRWNWDRNLNELYLSCQNPYFNNTWKVTDKGFIMIWKGNTAINVSGIQVRVIGTPTLPGG